MHKEIQNCTRFLKWPKIRKDDRLSVQALPRSSFLQTAFVSCGCELEFLPLWTGQFSHPSTGDCPRLSMWLAILFRQGQQCEKHGWQCITYIRLDIFSFFFFARTTKQLYSGHVRQFLATSALIPPSHFCPKIYTKYRRPRVEI